LRELTPAPHLLGDRGLMVLHERGMVKRPAIWRMPGGAAPKPKADKVVESSDPQPNAKVTAKVNGVKVLKTCRTQ
jgi:hypothetical protein